jgi:hypothetical protein
MSALPLNLVLALIAFTAGVGAVIVAVVLAVNTVG